MTALSEIKQVYAVVGLPTAGKTATIRVLANKLIQIGWSVHRCKISDEARRRLTTAGFPANREDISRCQAEGRARYGSHYWASELIRDIERCNSQVVLIEGIWVREELITIRNYFGKRLVLIGINAAPEVLHQRLSERLEGLDNGERAKETIRISNIIDTFPIRELLDLADIVIFNETNTKDDLESQIEAVLCAFQVVLL